MVNEREDAFHALAVTDATDGERLVQSVSPATRDHAGENLDAFLVAFHDFGVHPHRITDSKLRSCLCEIVPIQFFQVMPDS